jgi:N-sulfoglucosamine sulfohydrolase
MMDRREFIRRAALAAGGALSATLAPAPAPAAEPSQRPNILFITADDMNCDSVGVFGCQVEDTTPNLDRLAGEGIRFMHAHVQVANCVPSRNAMQTGRYPHTSGVEGFYKLQPDFPILPDVMKQRGYYTGIKGKVSHSTPYHPYPWDTVMDQARDKGAGRGNAQSYYDFTHEAIAASREGGKPFYLVVNIQDPHLPFYGLSKDGQEIEDKNKPTRIYSPDEIVVPGFLPDLPITRKELSHYYSSVRRADDCAGATLEALEDSGQAPNTAVMFLSDHGMPFPFAKTNVYHHSTHTPWIARWPGKTRAGSVDDAHMISAVDFMPTVLDVAGIPHPPGLQGRSFEPLLRGEKQDGRDKVFKDYNENSGGNRHPMRSVQTRKHGYIFNPWANGERQFRTATQGMATYREMQRLAESDKAVAARLRLFDYRVVEEFYDYENDPDAMRNLIDDPRYREEVDRLRQALEQWMIETNDPCLEAFRNRDNPEALDEFVNRQQQESDERRATSRKGQQGNAKNVASANGVKLAIDAPKSVSPGQTATITVNYTIPKALGEQPIQVTLKEASKKIERKIVKVRGAGSIEVVFDVPAEIQAGAVLFAAFVGKDYDGNLRHVVTKPVAGE